ncbi:capsule biosynthesis protein [Mannheimia massilioguelmaensis]|uniref:capsule biosynthesis protein n=1 Tax=Mannheimia massilioguelmaensis TaxID=1604354 RepID=UPI0005C8139D|nr:capsule biosynthesis protein [Mannheimia massilioguelmaensis]
MITHYLDELVASSNKILLLQGPIGPFFFQFGEWLSHEQGKTVYKINFNAGDDHFYPPSSPNTFQFSDHFVILRAYLKQFCREHSIDAMLCFGDNRHCHKIAKRVAEELNIPFWAFEEGYFRPNYVTLEKSGVNAYSPIPRESAFFLELAHELHEPHQPLHVAKGFYPMAKLATQYYVATYLAHKRYSHYKHHRILSLRYYIKLWVTSGIKRLCYLLKDRSFAKDVENGKFGQFFIVPLQVYDDSQISEHTDYESVEAFLRDVLISFANYAPPHINLIVKHHPMDRGFIDYSHVIEEIEQDYSNLKGRVFYIHDVPLPVFLRHGRGMVTLNSTSGVSALLHGMPVKTLGRANYDIPGLTSQSSLEEFWNNPQIPDANLFIAYRRYHLNKTQINGNFYNKVILRYPYNQS